MFIDSKTLKRSGAIIKNTNQDQLWVRKRQRSHSDGYIDEKLLVPETPNLEKNIIIRKVENENLNTTS